MKKLLSAKPGSAFTLLAASTLLAAPFAPAAESKAPIEAALPQPPASWAQRDAAPHNAQVAKEFLNLLVLDGSIRMPILLETAKLAKDKPDEAFNSYVAYFLKRLQNAEYNGLDAVLKNTEGNGSPPDREAAVRGAEKLMQGIANLGGQDVHIGEPGTVDWSTPWDKNADRPANTNLHTSAAFMPLAQAYLATGERKYLDRWIAYLDDWSLNDNAYFDRLNPLIVPDGINSGSGSTFRGTLRLFSKIENPALGIEAPIPPRVAAQVLEHFLFDLLPYHVTYIRSNTHNWTPSIGLVQIALIFQDFKVAPFYFREGLRRNIEDNAVTQNLRDGTENQQDHWYNPQYLKVGAMLDLLSADSSLPGWKELKNDYEWRRELRRHLQERVTWLIHDRTPQNSLPVPWNGGYDRRPETGEYSDSPAAFEDPINRAILAAVNGDKDADPGYTSEWFPYGGFNIVRDGWDRNDGWGTLFCSPMPGAYGGYRSRSNNNTFGLSASGQLLLMDDSTGHYMYPSSPLRVDGRNQFFHTGIYKVPPPASHKVFQVNAWWQPANWRWHASSNFNLMEGVYSGAYAEPADAKSVQGPYGTDQSQSGTMPRGAGINDVSHQRLVMYARDARLWIITDRLRSPGAHEYSQQWLFPLRAPADATIKENRTPASFDATKITADAAAKKIFTNEPTVPVASNGKMVDAPKANLSLYQFSAMPLEYSAKVEPRGKEYGYYLYYSRDRVQAKWKGTGDQQVVTIAFPRAPGTGAEGDLKSTKQITSGKSGLGFEAVTPDGKIVQYLASTLKDDTLALGNISIQGGALLREGDKGIVLGASRMAVGGKDVKIPASDFEFDLNGNAAPTFTPIYRPIAPVEIGPERNVFEGKVLVTLSSATPGVEIHYTTDGEEPTPQSPLYSKPFALTQTATVMARAYRPGVTQNPPQQSGTEVTVTSIAHFEKAALIRGIQTPRPNSGLNVNYYEGDWKQLFLRFDDQKPVASAKGVKLWDTGIIPASNPLVEKSGGSRARPYALEYSGFLNVPADGVYTLRAPDEYIWPATEAGYDLRVWLGNEMGKGVFRDRVVGKNQWYPATTLHAFGTWSVALQKGIHPFRVVFIDYRTDAAKQLNSPNLNPYIWDGATPDLKISGPDLKEQSIPDSWLLRPMER
jgi:hypothetical protein